MFDRAKESRFMPVKEIVILLRNTDYDCRLGAVSILDWKVRSKNIMGKEKAEIYQVYLDNQECIRRKTD